MAAAYRHLGDALWRTGRRLWCASNRWSLAFSRVTRPLMDRATMVVGHGGHGTTMRALSHGLPMVGIPAKGADQVPITKLIDQWGAGRALSIDPDVSQIRNCSARAPR